MNDLIVVGGGLAGLVEVDNPPQRVAPRLVFRCELAQDGRIEQVHAVLARAKLHALSA